MNVAKCQERDSLEVRRLVHALNECKPVKNFLLDRHLGCGKTLLLDLTFNILLEKTLTPPKTLIFLNNACVRYLCMSASLNKLQSEGTLFSLANRSFNIVNHSFQ